MQEIPLEHPIDLAATLNSGQAFHWTPEGRGFAGTVGPNAAYVEQRDPLTVGIDSSSVDAVCRYLALDHDLARIFSAFPKRDKPLRLAMDFAPGLRILRQPHWECLATFITSSLKQVAHIRQISLRLRETFGTPVDSVGSTRLHAYPTPEALANAGEKALRDCGLGYRAAFLHRTATAIRDGALDLRAVATLDDVAARKALCQLYGVGEKIADCVLLFAYERHASFPVDVWIERVLRQLYFGGAPEITPRAIREFARSHFGPYGGYAQQFLFHYARVTGLKESGRLR